MDNNTATTTEAEAESEMLGNIAAAYNAAEVK